jgi:hypothetical protein
VQTCRWILGSNNEENMAHMREAAGVVPERKSTVELKVARVPTVVRAVVDARTMGGGSGAARAQPQWSLPAGGSPKEGTPYFFRSGPEGTGATRGGYGLSVGDYL